jgi:hypothetical protein
MKHRLNTEKCPGKANFSGGVFGVAQETSN